MWLHFRACLVGPSTSPRSSCGGHRLWRPIWSPQLVTVTLQRRAQTTNVAGQANTRHHTSGGHECGEARRGVEPNMPIILYHHDIVIRRGHIFVATYFIWMVHYIIYVWPYMYYQHLWKIGPDLQIQQSKSFSCIFRAEALSSRKVFLQIIIISFSLC
jgi:hypothetical protein